MPLPLPPGFTAIKDAASDGAFVSLIGVVVSVEDPRPTKGTDWVLNFGIQDEFGTGLVGSSTSINCRVFWPKDKLPKISGPGDIAILRKFKLNVWNMRFDCVGHARSGSGVLIFPASKIPVPELSQAYQVGSQRLPYNATFGTRDPTVPEQMEVIRLKQAASGSVKQVQQHAATVSFKAPPPDKLSLIKDLDFSRFYDVRVQVVNTYYSLNGTFELKVTDYTENKNLFYYADPAGEDAYMVTNKNWTGPYGQLTLSVILYGNNVIWVKQNVSVGDFIYLKNMRTKMSPANMLEGVIHEDRERPNQVDVRKLIKQSDIGEINKRREAYERQRGTKSALQVLQDVPNNLPEKPASKKALKKQRQQEQREQKEAELKELEEKAEGWEVARSGVNKNIRAAFPEIKLSTISEILYTPHLQMRSPKYHDYKLPFVNAKHRARVRVIDVFPPELELFAHSVNDPKWNKRPKKKDPSNGHSRERWEWGFVLLLEDANVPPNTVSEKLRVVVGNDVGQGLLNLNAVDLKNSPRILSQLEQKLFILWGNLLELKTELRDRGSDLPLPPGDNRLQNKPFDCCIEEYGHEVPITDANPFGYQRMHRLAQTHIGT